MERKKRYLEHDQNSNNDNYDSTKLDKGFIVLDRNGNLKKDAIEIIINEYWLMKCHCLLFCNESHHIERTSDEVHDNGEGMDKEDRISRSDKNENKPNTCRHLQRFLEHYSIDYQYLHHILIAYRSLVFNEFSELEDMMMMGKVDKMMKTTGNTNTAMTSLKEMSEPSTDRLARESNNKTAAVLPSKLSKIEEVKKEFHVRKPRETKKGKAIEAATPIITSQQQQQQQQQQLKRPVNLSSGIHYLNNPTSMSFDIYSRDLSLDIHPTLTRTEKEMNSLAEKDNSNNMINNDSKKKEEENNEAEVVVQEVKKPSKMMFVIGAGPIAISTASTVPKWIEEEKKASSLQMIMNSSIDTLSLFSDSQSSRNAFDGNHGIDNGKKLLNPPKKVQRTTTKADTNQKFQEPVHVESTEFFLDYIDSFDDSSKVLDTNGNDKSNNNETEFLKIGGEYSDAIASASASAYVLGEPIQGASDDKDVAIKKRLGKDKNGNQRGRPRKRDDELKVIVKQIVIELNECQSRSNRVKPTCRNIADILKEKHGMNVSFPTVHRLMKEIDNE